MNTENIEIPEIPTIPIIPWIEENHKREGQTRSGKIWRNIDYG